MKHLRKIYAFRNKYYLSIYDTCIKSRKFVAEGLLYKSKRNLVFGLHDIFVCSNGRVCLRQYHIQEKVCNIFIEILTPIVSITYPIYKLFKDNVLCICAEKMYHWKRSTVNIFLNQLWRRDWQENNFKRILPVWNDRDHGHH